MFFWQSDRYTEFYRTVMQDGDDIEAIMRQHRLIPPPLEIGYRSSTDSDGEVVSMAAVAGVTTMRLPPVAAELLAIYRLKLGA